MATFVTSTLTSMILLESVIHLSRTLIPAAACYAVQRGWIYDHRYSEDTAWMYNAEVVVDTLLIQPPVHFPHIARLRLPHATLQGRGSPPALLRLTGLAFVRLLSRRLKPHLAPRPATAAGALSAAPSIVESLTHLTAFRGFAGTSVLIMVRTGGRGGGGECIGEGARGRGSWACCAGERRRRSKGESAEGRV